MDDREQRGCRCQQQSAEDHPGADPHTSTLPALVGSAEQHQWTAPPAPAKKVTSVLAAPMSIAAAPAIRTPVLPLPATCGFEECEPIAQAIADSATPATAAIRPKVSRAPTICSRATI